MTVPTQENQTPPSDKELNFRALENKYAQQLAAERAEKERLMQELQSRQQAPQDDDDDSEPYVDHKKLNKKLARFGEQSKQQTQQEIQHAVQAAIREERQSNWIKQNPDFYEVLKHAEKFAQKDPDLAESILQMPEGFERQKLVYKNIKALGIDRPEVKQPSIQEKVDANRKSPYYQPSSVGSAPYSQSSDFSPAGQKQAYEKAYRTQESAEDIMSTELEKGIIVYIDSDELDRLKLKKGFLDYQNYPDEYKEISIYAEVGRFLFFRFILK